MAEPGTFGTLLRGLRNAAGLTQEELAAAAQLSVRSVSDLERGVNLTARKETARLLADALHLTGLARTEFEAVARGRTPSEEHPASFGDDRGPDGAIRGVASARALPRDIASFIGREPELRDLLAVAADDFWTREALAVYAIGGMAGIGKTALAVHAAHRLAPQFPDGQIFVSLHAHTPGQRPVASSDALASLLLTVGVAASRVPPTLEARMAMWRDYLADKHLLLVLDDAADHDQVRPLLPGVSGSLVLVTSRKRLTALEDASSISLDIFATPDAIRMLVRLADRPGIDSGDAAVAEIARMCGNLPLALGMLARQIHHHPTWTPADVAVELAEAVDRLELMHTENMSVAAAFNMSYEDLGPDEKRVLRYVGLHPGTDVDAYAVAALEGSEPREGRRHLRALYDHYLLAEPARGRFRLHDLIREYARVLAEADPAASRDAALGRLLDFYLHTARAAGRHLARRTPAWSYAAPPPTHPLDVSALSRAITWLDTERLNLHASADYAASHARVGHAIAIPAAILDFLRYHGPWDQVDALCGAALGAARGRGDLLAEADTLTNLGDIQYLPGNYPSATASVVRALELSRDLGDQLGEANALAVLGKIQNATSDYLAAHASLTHALELYWSIGDRLGEASVFCDLGVVSLLTGDLPAAIAHQERALEGYRELGSAIGEANALNQLGVVQKETGDYQAAISSLSQAIGLHHALGNRLGEASASSNLGNLLRMTGNYPAAAANLTRALELHQSLGERLGQAIARNNLGNVQRHTGDYLGAAANLTRALKIYRDLGSRLGEASALNDFGALHLATGDHQMADACLRQALELYREIGDRLGEAEVLNTTGQLLLATNVPAEARTHHEHALAIANDASSLPEQARAHEGLGLCQFASGQPGDGAARLRKALVIYQRIGSPAAHRVRQKLDGYAQEVGLCRVTAESAAVAGVTPYTQNRTISAPTWTLPTPSGSRS